MTDLDVKFRELDRLDASLAWENVATRAPASPRDPRRRVKLVAAIIGVAAALVALAIVIHPLTRLGGGDRHPALSTGGSPSVSPSGSPGMVGASGLVIAYLENDVRFCAGAMTLALTPGPPACSAQIHVTGVDLSRLSDAVTRNGATWGTAYLAGTLENGTLLVTDQGPPRGEPTSPRLTDPPCLAPSGGWARSSGENPTVTAVDAYEHDFPSDLISVAVFRPDAGTWVITLASTDPARTMDKLGADYPDRLCVVRSRYTAQEVNDARAAADSLLPSGGNDPYQVTGVGLTVGEDGQPVVEVDAVSDTPEIEQALASQPPGLINVVPWLRPLPATS